MTYSRKSRSSSTISASRVSSTPSESPVRFARRRFGRYEVLDFVAVLFGYAISGERTLETFYECLHPFAAADHWRSSDGSACQHARRSRAFWRL
jgi:hypothetical protein